jgi:tRNA (cytosine49-C5)-methyltransferase
MERVFQAYRDIIPAFDALQERLKTPLPQHVRVNTLKIGMEPLLRALERRGIFLEKTPASESPFFLAPKGTSPGKWLEYGLGYIHPQALTSCLASLFLAPEPGSSVLDLCAAPGGKTSHLSQLMKGEGLIVANELQRKRHLPLHNTLSRLGVMNAICTAYPAQEFPLKYKFDYILADVPCSGEGTFRYGVDHNRQPAKEGRANLYEVQKRIVLRGFDLLKTGGRMLYATCTYNPEENESIVAHLLRHRDAEILPIESPLPFRPGLSGWNKEIYDERMEHAARFYPHFLDSVGFFMARVGKKG